MRTICFLLAVVCKATTLVIPLAGTNTPNGTLDADMLSRISCAIEIVKASKDSSTVGGGIRSGTMVVASGGFSQAKKLGMVNSPKHESHGPKIPGMPKSTGYITHATLVYRALVDRGLPNEALLSNRLLGKAMDEEAVMTANLVRGPYANRTFSGTPSIIVVASESQAESANALFGYSLSNCTGIPIQYNVSVCTNGHVGATVKPKKIEGKDKAQVAMGLILPFLGNKSSATWLRFVNKNMYCNSTRVVQRGSVRATKKGTLAKTLTDLVQREAVSFMRRPHFLWYVAGTCLGGWCLCLCGACVLQLYVKGEWPEQWNHDPIMKRVRPYTGWSKLDEEDEEDGGATIGRIEDDNEEFGGFTGGFTIGEVEDDNEEDVGFAIGKIADDKEEDAAEIP